MKSVAILQARTNSSRLPGKVLLPVGGYPLSVLAAKRAGNTGRDVVVATSSEDSDIVLANTLTRYGLSCYRGNLNDPLNRFVEALSNYPDDTLVFRLTGDNVFPDGRLLDELEIDFVERELDYLSCTGSETGLPYGVSVEVMYLLGLREADQKAVSQSDREHVTPYIRRKFGVKEFTKYRYLRKSHFRATVDSLDDYLGIQAVFDNVEDAVNVSFTDLISRLDNVAFQPISAEPISKFVLGTAQLGMIYGIANAKGMPDQAQTTKLIKTAIINGALALDTARAYGNSERVIGNALSQGWQGRTEVITKLSPMAECHEDTKESEIKALVECSVYRSCYELRTKMLDTVLLHRAAHRTAWGGAVWARLLQFKRDGVVKKLGVSIQSPEELRHCLQDETIEHVQIPFNILDDRWNKVIGLIQSVQKERDFQIHIRSALLQGLLPSIDSELWRHAGFSNYTTVTGWLEHQRKKYDFPSVAALCIAYCFSQSWIDGVVIGVESAEQLTENIQIFTERTLNRHQLEEIHSSRPSISEHALNPVNWQKGS